MIKNTTKKELLAKKARYCKTMLSKATGLMFSKKIKDEGLVFFFEEPTPISFHMLFVFYPIDILFLDEKRQVIELKESFKPFTFYSSKKKIKYAVELPDKTIEKTSTTIGDRMSF